ncbi:hypothetical protein [Microbacterium hibisci]|uniref:hypothetical protein n=1 Tax=Microbacterium hibisci TaxID=2036000 RepID=UPI001940B8B1|nr:hypothetical protein [Microbacterium hibisci]
MHAIWAPIASLITQTANSYPSIYALVAQSPPDALIDTNALVASGDPAAARALVTSALRKVVQAVFVVEGLRFPTLENIQKLTDRRLEPSRGLTEEEKMRDALDS